ncbi:unnamed protein product [Dimorphilus gyrociliatus]|uniref:C2H2-type domain-containing protein n=1 Tax=Dimorphilus gyrociliatus TaxID=2664684 RepID=A0A7I8WCW5_9ANNE|nr:unnamed protein product [Dimorphilus gyrociliatus]
MPGSDEKSIPKDFSSRVFNDSSIESRRNEKFNIPIITLNDADNSLAESYLTEKQTLSYGSGIPKRVKKDYKGLGVCPWMDEPYPHDCVSVIKLEKPLKPGIVKCELCPYKSAPSVVKAHQIVHSTEKTFDCRLCKKSFKWVQSLRRHISTVHVGIKKALCPNCGKSLATRHS